MSKKRTFTSLCSTFHLFLHSQVLPQYLLLPPYHYFLQENRCRDGIEYSLNRTLTTSGPKEVRGRKRLPHSDGQPDEKERSATAGTDSAEYAVRHSARNARSTRNRCKLSHVLHQQPAAKRKRGSGNPRLSNASGCCRSVRETARFANNSATR